MDWSRQNSSSTPKSAGMGTPRSRSVLGVGNNAGGLEQQPATPQHANQAAAGGPATKTPRSTTRNVDRPWREQPPSVMRVTPRRLPPSLGAKAAAGAAARSGGGTPPGTLPSTPSSRSLGGDGSDAAAGSGAGGAGDAGGAFTSQGSDDLSSLAGDGAVDEFYSDYSGGGGGDAVRVVIRMRPANPIEEADPSHYMCAATPNTREVVINLPNREPYNFAFDDVLPEETGQAEVFEMVGAPAVDNVLSGYNSSIFAYGQTGAGKTHTMTGRVGATAAGEPGDERGLAPRVFEYLFERIAAAQDAAAAAAPGGAAAGAPSFTCRCSMLEIYNEVITDLLAPSATGLQVREDARRGAFVEGLTEAPVQNADDALAALRRGAENRRVGETRLNRESSRSHSVFTLIVERTVRQQQQQQPAAGGGAGGAGDASAAGAGGGDGSGGELTKVVFSRLNLVDLAGSERVRGGAHGGSGAAGGHFKEACHINRSLTTLGRVINELVRAQAAAAAAAANGGSGSGGANGRRASLAPSVPVHVPYRDSRLTFLLQDSLGGNAKTMIVANVSPSSVCAQETLSTLNFARRAKVIRNRATVNVDVRGDAALMQAEIARLNAELDGLRRGLTDPIVQECKDLRRRLAEEAAAREDLEGRLELAANDNAQLRRERRRLDDRLAVVHGMAGDLSSVLLKLSSKVARYEAAERAARAAAADASQAQAEEASAAAAVAAAEASAAAAAPAGGGLLPASKEVLDELAQLKAALASAQAHASSSEHDAAAAAAATDALRRTAAQMRDAARGAEARAAAAEEHATAAEVRATAAEERATAAEERIAAAEGAAVREAAARRDAERAVEEAAAEVASLSSWLEQQKRDAAELGQRLAETEVRAAAAERAAAERAAAGSEEAAALRAALGEAEAEAALRLERAEAHAAELERASAALKAELTQRAEAAEAARDAASTEGQWLRAKLSSAEGQLEAAQLELRARAEALDTARAELAAARRDAAAAADAADATEHDLNSRLVDADAQIEGLQAELAGAKARAASAEAALRADLSDAAEAAGALAADKARLEARLADARRDADAERARLQGQVDDAHAAAAAAAVEACNERERFDRELEDAHTTAAEREAELKQVRADLEAAAGRLEARRADLAAAQAELADTRAALERERQRAAGAEAAGAALEAANAEVAEELQALQRRAAAQVSELQSRLADAVGRNASLELDTKESLEAQARHARALSKIRRLVEWAADDPRGSRAFVSGRLAQAMRAAQEAAASSSHGSHGSASASGSGTVGVAGGGTTSAGRAAVARAAAGAAPAAAARMDAAADVDVRDSYADDADAGEAAESEGACFEADAAAVDDDSGGAGAEYSGDGSGGDDDGYGDDGEDTGGDGYEGDEAAEASDGGPSPAYPAVSPAIVDGDDGDDADLSGPSGGEEEEDGGSDLDAERASPRRPRDASPRHHGRHHRPLAWAEGSADKLQPYYYLQQHQPHSPGRQPQHYQQQQQQTLVPAGLGPMARGLAVARGGGGGGGGPGGLRDDSLSGRDRLYGGGH